MSRTEPPTERIEPDAAVARPAVPPRRAAWRSALFLLALACLFCWPVCAGRIMVPADSLLAMVPWSAYARDFGVTATQNEMLDPIEQYLPWRQYAVDSLRSGVIPLWNPYSGCGAPFLANLQSTLLYPPNVIFLLVGPGRGFGLSALLHLFLGGLFMFGFLRALELRPTSALVGAVVFTTNGFVISWLEYPTLGLWTTMWLPLALWLLELSISRRRFLYSVGCGLALGLDLLAGHLQVAVYVLLTVAIYALVRGLSLRQVWRAVAGLAVAMALGVGLALAQLLPALELAGNSLRAAGDARQALATRMPWDHLVIYLLPSFFGNPAHHDYWGQLNDRPINFFETTGYVGILTLLLAACGLRAGWARRLLPVFPASYFALITGAALLVALGTPLYYVLYYAAPGFGQFRGLARILFLVAFGLAGLSSLGTEALLSRERPGRVWPVAAAAGTMVAVALTATLRFLAEIPGGFASYLSSQWLLFLALLVTAVAVVYLRLVQKLSPAWFGRLALLHVACDLAIVGVGFNPAVDARLGFFPTQATTLLQERIGSGRMTSLGSHPGFAMPANTPLAYRLRDIHAYDSLLPANYERLFVTGSEGHPSQWPLPGDPFLNVAGVSYLLTDVDLALPDWEPVPIDEGGTRIYRNRKALPRAYLQPAGVVRFDEDGSDRVRLTVTSRSNARLVLSDTRYPGWRLRVDGKLAPAQEAPPMFRAVDIGPGEHHVSWEYDPASFRVGLFVSLLWLAGLAGVGGAVVVRRARTQG